MESDTSSGKTSYYFRGARSHSIAEPSRPSFTVLSFALVYTYAFSKGACIVCVAHRTRVALGIGRSPCFPRPLSPLSSFQRTIKQYRREIWGLFPSTIHVGAAKPRLASLQFLHRLSSP